MFCFNCFDIILNFLNRLKELGKFFLRLFIKNIALSLKLIRVVPARWVYLNGCYYSSTKVAQ